LHDGGVVTAEASWAYESDVAGQRFEEVATNALLAIPSAELLRLFPSRVLQPLDAYIPSLARPLLSYGQSILTI
jgi:hypothetical protein